MKIRMFFAVLALAMTVVAEGKVEHLLPMPKQVTMTEGAAPLMLTGRLCFASQPSERVVRAFRHLTGLQPTDNVEAPHVEIAWADSIEGAYDYLLAGYPNEAYRLSVSKKGIRIVAVTETGVIRAIQTFAQLMEGTPENQVEACEIVDWPAFKLRGLMHDVGRSYISVAELKKQLRLLGRFKVNTFHFHLTENQAWRFEVKRYPQLTDAATMTRFAGKYYTQEECRDIVRTAADYGITVIPEIDMPGHSAAFVRAMGHSMQTDQGVEELKHILDELMDVFADAPYIHIGADEQAITYSHFLETITSHIHDRGRRVVVWNPISGVSITNSMGADMTQMWSTAGKKIAGMANIDCRYNYVNHFDVFADLVGIYRSNIYYRQQGSEEIAGEITAVWNDRYIEDEQGIMRQNNVYANVLASAERAWKGGGRQYIEDGGTLLPTAGEELEEFVSWEQRFLFHKAHSLVEENIPYVRQTNVRWTITDAFPNDGDADKVLPPETEGPKPSYTWQGQTYNTGEAVGAAVYLRHTWGSIVPGFYADPQLGQTAYAWTYVFSPKEQKAGALVEFQNYGRSEKDLAPSDGRWDRKGSRLWVNDEELLPPSWDNASLERVDNETPLKNENLTARKPVVVQLRRGWNKVFIKLPYVAAQGVRLNKWMFTFVLTDIEGKDALPDIVYQPKI